MEYMQVPLSGRGVAQRHSTRSWELAGMGRQQDGCMGKMKWGNGPASRRYEWRGMAWQVFMLWVVHWSGTKQHSRELL
jgi:hypothetical protein